MLLSIRIFVILFSYSNLTFHFAGCPKEAFGFRGSLGFSKPSWYEMGNCSGGGDVDLTKSGTSTTTNYFLYDSAHISQTYVALCSLLILGDDLTRVDRKAVLEGICCGQLSDGRFELLILQVFNWNFAWVEQFGCITLSIITLCILACYFHSLTSKQLVS